MSKEMGKESHGVDMDQNLEETMFGSDQPVKELQRGQEPTFLVMGDLNMEMDRPDNELVQWKKLSARALIETILTAMSVRWLSVKEFLSVGGTRGNAVLDYICVPTSWSGLVHSMEVCSMLVSDHSLVLAKVLMDIEDKLLPPYWRFKNALLDCPKFISSMEIFLKEKLESKPRKLEDFTVWWDNLKMEINQVSKRSWKRQSNYLMSRGEDQEKRQAGFGGQGFPKKIYFLKGENGMLIENQEDILDETADFYEKLYTASPEVVEPPENMTFGLKKIDSDLLKELELPLSLENLHQAAMSMNMGKAPGRDGLSLEFFLKFWSLLGPVVMDCFNCFLKLGRLVGMTSVGVITLIPKGGDLRQIGNWRPITLLAVELKIILKALANKLTPAIRAVVPQWQTSLPGNSIFSSLAVVRDLISIHSGEKRKRKPLYIVALDQAKAFDRVSHKFLFHLLRVIGLPSYLLEALRAVYSGFYCVVKNVDSLSRPFKYGRGIRQGDPTSTLLYALAIQPALNALHLALYDEGFLFPDGDRVLLTAYADDVSVFLNNPWSVQKVVETFNYITRFSEAELNLTKSKILALNIPKEVDMKEASGVLPMTLVQDKVKILGIDFSASLNILPEVWNRRMMATRRVMAGFYPQLRRMTFLQRAHWAKKKLWPRWAFLFKVLQPTKGQLDQLTSLLSEVIWLGGRHWLSTAEVAARTSVGGLGAMWPHKMVNTLRIGMIVRLSLAPSTVHVVKLAQVILDKYGGLQAGLKIFCSRPDHSLVNTLPLVYSTAFTAWDCLKTCRFAVSKEDILAMPVVLSKFLLQLDEPVVLDGCMAQSMQIKTIEDLYYFIPSVTRASGRLVALAREAVDKWIEQPWPEGVERSEIGLLYGTLGVPYYLLKGEIWLPMHRWTNRIIADCLLEEVDFLKNQEVPRETWKLLFSVQAPSVFLNQVWRFMHLCSPTATFFFHMGIVEKKACVLCQAEDISISHQFRTCSVLQAMVEEMNAFAAKLELPSLLNMWQLYPEPMDEHRLENFLVMAYIYTVVTLIRSVENYKSSITGRRALEIFRLVIRKHLLCHACRFPPNRMELRHKWKVYTHMGVIAFFRSDQLFIVDKENFSKFAESYS